jgi:hypothetical protein
VGPSAARVAVAIALPGLSAFSPRLLRLWLLVLLRPLLLPALDRRTGRGAIGPRVGSRLRPGLRWLLRSLLLRTEVAA